MGIGLAVSGRTMKRNHKLLCFTLWGIWGLGLCFTGVSRFGFQHNNDLLFWEVVVPYNQVVQLVSFIPLEPLFCVLAICDSKKQKQPYNSAIVFFVITFLFWLMYAVLYVWWTGGV